MKKWIARFCCAGRGCLITISREPSARIHAAAIVLVAIMGLWLEVGALEWSVLALACGSVLGAECLNTAVERLADRVTQEREPAIRIVKDAAAGGVLVATLGAVGAGIGIFGPRLWSLIFC